MIMERGWSLAAVLCLGLMASASFGQAGKLPQEQKPSTKSPTANPTPHAATLGAVRFNEKPLRVDSMGLTISLPLGANATSSAIGNQSALKVTGPDSKWMSGARILESSDTKLALEQVVEANLRSQLGGETFIVGETGPSGSQLIEHTKNLVIGTIPAERFYVLGPKSDDPKQANRARLIWGVTFLKLAPGRFAIFEASCGEGEFERSKPEMEAMIATAKFADASSIASSRRALLDAGDRFLQGLDPTAIRSAAMESKEMWWRLYVPAITGADADAREIGYRRIRTSIGKRGQLDPSRDPKTFKGADLDEGILVQVDFRGILGETGDVLTDSQGVFFQTLDRKEEAWSLSTRVRQDKKDQTSIEFGSRMGNQISVKKDARSNKLIVPDTAYLSRVEAFLLQRLLVTSRLTTEFAFQTYSSESDLIEVRHESVEQPADKPKIFRITTRSDDGPPSQVTTLRDNGDLIFADLAGGVRIEPTSLDQLARLWKSKGLPLD